MSRISIYPVITDYTILNKIEDLVINLLQHGEQI